MRLTKQFVQRTLSEDDPWSIGNQVLYELCRRYPHHTVVAEIEALIWLAEVAPHLAADSRQTGAD